MPLPSWHSSIDSLTVWKRTKTSIVDSSFYAYIPAEERIDLEVSCPSMRHLLSKIGNEEEEKMPAKAASGLSKSQKKRKRSKK